MTAGTINFDGDEHMGAPIIRDLALAHDTGQDVPTDSVDVYGLPPGWQLHRTDPRWADSLRDNPRRASGTVDLHDVDSFIAYVRRHDDAQATTLWIDLNDAHAVAVLNDHAHPTEDPTTDAGWGDYRARFTPQVTPEWARWLNADGTLYDQENFAEFIEDGIAQIADPDGATLLEIVQTLQGHTGAQWRSGHRLRDGRVQFGYVEEVTATAGETGELSIPGDFTLALAPFYGENPVPLRARFRYRVNSGRVRMGFKLDDPQLVYLNAVRAIAGRLDEAFGAERVFRGTPR